MSVPRTHCIVSSCQVIKSGRPLVPRKAAPGLEKSCYHTVIPSTLGNVVKTRGRTRLRLMNCLRIAPTFRLCYAFGPGPCKVNRWKGSGVQHVMNKYRESYGIHNAVPGNLRFQPCGSSNLWSQKRLYNLISTGITCGYVCDVLCTEYVWLAGWQLVRLSA